MVNISMLRLVSPTSYVCRQLDSSCDSTFRSTYSTSYIRGGTCRLLVSVVYTCILRGTSINVFHCSLPSVLLGTADILLVRSVRKKFLSYECKSIDDRKKLGWKNHFFFLSNSLLQCFLMGCLTFSGECGSPYCKVMYCLNVRHKILLMNDIQCCQYDAGRTAILRVSRIQNNTNESEYDIFKHKMFWRIVVLKCN